MPFSPFCLVSRLRHRTVLSSFSTVWKGIASSIFTSSKFILVTTMSRFGFNKVLISGLTLSAWERTTSASFIASRTVVPSVSRLIFWLSTAIAIGKARRMIIRLPGKIFASGEGKTKSFSPSSMPVSSRNSPTVSLSALASKFIPLSENSTAKAISRSKFRFPNGQKK